MMSANHERDALLVYRNTCLQQGGHVNFQLHKTGLRLCVEFPYIGASADSIAWCDCHGSRVVEVKCPYKHRYSTLDEMTAHPTFCLGKDLHLKRKHSYYTQTQLHMYVYDVSMCDFVVWSRNVCLIVEVVRDTDFVLDISFLSIGASPDCIVESNCCGKGTVEVKCTYCY